MNILIVGGSGLIGQSLTEHLIALGHEVSWLSRNSSTSRSNAIQRYDYPAFFSQNRNFDAVVNLAGESISQYWSKKAKRNIRESRIDTTRKLCAAIKSGQLNTGVFISGSAIGIYGDGGDNTLNEASPVGSGFLAETARLWEMESINTSVRTVQLRTGIVLSTKGGVLPLWTKSSKYGLGIVFGSGRQYVPWIHIDDMSRLIIHAINNDSICGPLNACSPEPATMKSLQKSIAEKLVRPQFLYLPKIISQLTLKDMTELFLFSQKAQPAKALDNGFQFNYPNLEAALTNLFQPQKKA